MATKMSQYAKGANKPIPRGPRINVSPTLDFPKPGKVAPMRAVPLAGHKKGGKG